MSAAAVLALLPPIRLTSNAITISIQMRSVAGLASIHWRSPGRARFGTIAECAALRVSVKRATLLLVLRSRNTSVTMVFTRAAIVMAAFAVKTAGMGEGKAAVSEQQNCQDVSWTAQSLNLSPIP